ncbi:hypothetical protein LINGRAHAP2_LOCUS5518 [Linum grandiflorum]
MTSMRSLSCSIRISVNVNGRLRSTIFTTKRICGADYLANIGHSFVFGFHSFDSLDRGLSYWFHYYIIDVPLHRSVSVLNNN